MLPGPPPPILGAKPGPGYGGGGPRTIDLDAPGITPASVTWGRAPRKGTVTEPAAA